MENKLTLGYWPIRGLAQPLRFFLHYVGLEYNDKRYNDRDEWFSKDKPSFNSKLANLPYIKDGDKVYFETDALFYVIANKANRLDLLGKDGEQQIQVAVLRSLIYDARSQIVNLVYDKANFETRKPQVLENVFKKFDIINDILGKSNYVTGDTITYIDFVLWEYIDQLQVLSPGTLDKFEHVKAYNTRFMELPTNKAYLESQDYIARPFNNPNYAAFY